MIDINTTALNPTAFIPSGSYQYYVRIEDCKAYVQSTLFWNKIYLLMLIVTVILFAWYVWKREKFEKEKKIVNKILGEEKKGGDEK